MRAVAASLSGPGDTTKAAGPAGRAWVSIGGDGGLASAAGAAEVGALRRGGAGRGKRGRPFLIFGVLARLVTDGRAAALVEPRAMLVITGIGVVTILLRRARRVGRCDWCGGRFCDDGLCVWCRRPA
jgi:hypothetical protein